MGAASDIFRSPTFWLGMLILFAMFIAGYGVIAWTRRWMKDSRFDEMDLGDQLEHYRELRDSGELSEAEFEQISNNLFGRKVDPSSSNNSEPDKLPPDQE